MNQTTFNQKNIKLCSYALYFFLLLLIVEILIYIPFLLNSLFSSQAADIINTGFSYRFDLPIGFGEINFNNLYLGKEINNSSLFIFSSILAGIITSRIPMILILVYGIKIVRAFTTFETPFSPKIPIYIRNIGNIFIVIGFLGKLVMQLLINLITFNKVYFNNPIDIKFLIIGVIVILLSDIFKRGVILQQNDDETL